MFLVDVLFNLYYLIAFPHESTWISLALTFSIIAPYLCTVIFLEIKKTKDDIRSFGNWMKVSFHLYTGLN